MGMRSLLGVAVALLLASTLPARAQSDISPQPAKPDVSLDQRVVQILAKKESGIVLSDVLVGPQKCSTTDLVFRRADDRAKRTTASGSGTFFGNKTGHGAIKVLVPGEYLVSAILCRSATRVILNGPYAKFSVRGGELVDIGVLKIDYTVKSDGIFTRTGTGNLHKAVAAMDPDTKAYIAKTYPSSVARIVRRPMALIGPADTAIKTRLR